MYDKIIRNRSRSEVTMRWGWSNPAITPISRPCNLGSTWRGRSLRAEPFFYRAKGPDRATCMLDVEPQTLEHEGLLGAMQEWAK
jgi:hypothetical protein